MKKWSLNGKVILVIAILAFGAIAISAMGIRSMSGINQDLKHIIRIDVKRDQLTSLMTDSQRLASIALRDVIIERDDARMKAFRAEYNKGRDNVFKYTDEYIAMIPEGSKQMVLAKQYKEIAKRFFEANEKALAFASENKDAEVADIRARVVAPILKELTETINKLNQETAANLEQSALGGQENFESGRNIMLLISFISIAASLCLAFFVLREVTREIDQVIVGLTDSSNQVTSAAQQIAASSEELSQAATEQASSLEQTAASIQEMSSMV